MTTITAILCLTSALAAQPIPGRDVLGEEELAAPTDPGFASVSRHFPAMKYSFESLGVKDGPQEIRVRPDGLLALNETAAWFAAGIPAIPLGKHACTKHLLEGYLPVVLAAWEHDGLSYQQTALGWSPQLSPDTPLAVFIRLRIANAAARSRALDLHFLVKKIAGAGIACGRLDPQLVATEPLAKWAVEVPAQGEYGAYVKIPFAKPAAAEKIDAAEFDKRLSETVGFWTVLLSRGMKIHVPEQRVNDAYRAWLAYNFINVDKRGNVLEPHDGGGGFYEGVYGYSASRYCVALDVLGYPREAQEYLDSLMAFVRADGLMVTRYGLPDMGAQLWAMGRHYQTTGDAAWLRKVAPRMIRMCKWITDMRKSSMLQQAQDSAWYGLIKYHPYADEPTPAYSFYTDTYLLLGLEETAAALRDVGMTGEAARIASGAEAYRKDILAAMDKAVIEHGGMKMLPIFPETHALLKRVGYTGADYYGLISSCMLETGVLPANDRRARLVTDLIEQRGGLCLGSCSFRDGIDHAYTYGYWMNCLERDEVKRVILGFYSSLAYGMSQDTYAAVEVTRLRTGDNASTLPHLYSNTQQLLLLRNMLLRESGDTLIFGQGIPRSWLESGKEVRIEDAPTSFGNAGYVIKSHDGAARMTVCLDLPQKRPPKAIAIRLRHPAGKSIQSVKIDGVESKTFSADTLTLTAVNRRTIVEAGF